MLGDGCPFHSVEKPRERLTIDGGVTGELFGDSAPIDVGGLGLYPASFVNDRGKNI